MLLGRIGLAGERDAIPSMVIPSLGIACVAAYQSFRCRRGAHLAASISVSALGGTAFPNYFHFRPMFAVRKGAFTHPYKKVCSRANIANIANHAL